MKLIVGLGNPGQQYLSTRHNLGFMVLDALVKKWNLPDFEEDKKFKGQIVKFSLEDGGVKQEVIFLKPQTSMNLSGLSVAAVANFYKIPSEDIIVIHDELDLLMGHIKVRIGGAAAGHHGLESIIQSLGTDNFVRVRLGIGNDRSHSGEHKRISFSAEKFVLEPFLPEENHDVKHLLKKALEAIKVLLADGVEKAQNQYN